MSEKHFNSQNCPKLFFVNLDIKKFLKFSLKQILCLLKNLINKLVQKQSCFEIKKFLGSKKIICRCLVSMLVLSWLVDTHNQSRNRIGGS